MMGFGLADETHQGSRSEDYSTFGHAYILHLPGNSAIWGKYLETTALISTQPPAQSRYWPDNARFLGFVFQFGAYQPPPPPPPPPPPDEPPPNDPDEEPGAVEDDAAALASELPMDDAKLPVLQPCEEPEYHSGE